MVNKTTYNVSRREQEFFNGTIHELFDAIITSDGATITLTLTAASGASNLTLAFSDGHTLFDVSSSTIALTAGASDDPQKNYIYILQSNKTLTKSTSNWPATEHIRIGFFLVQTAAIVAADGELINQNWNDHLSHTEHGHVVSIAAKLRVLHATYFDGINGAGDDVYLTNAAGNTEFKSTSGNVFQVHKMVFPAIDTSGSDSVHVKNWFEDSYHDIADLFEITDDSGGNTIGANKYFNLVFWGVANKSGEHSPIMCNLPSGFYNTQSAAENDVSGYDDFTIPREFNIDSSTGFLICRITIKMAGTWIHQSTVDLRGTTPQTASGGASGVAVEFPDSTFRVYDNTNNTKIAALDVGTLVAAGNTRTLQVPNANGVIALTSDVSAAVSDVAYDEGTWNGVTTIANSKNALRDWIEAHAGSTTVHHTKYTDVDAINAVEAIGVATPVAADWFIYSDAGVLKRALISGINHAILSGLGGRYTDSEAVDAIEAIGEAAAVDSDYLVYIDSGVLKKDTISDILALGAGGGDATLADNENVTGLWEFSNVSGLKTDDIVERTGGHGVEIDSVLLKDGLVDGIDVAGRDHAKYTDGEAIDAVEAVAVTVPVAGDWMIYSDAGVLKRALISGLTHAILSGLGGKYTNANAVDAIEAVGTATSVAGDWMIFSDAGVLKRQILSGLTHGILTGLGGKYTDANAVDAIEAVGEAVAVGGDYLIYIDNGVLKKDTITDILALGAGGGDAVLADNETVTGAWIIDNATGLTFNNQGAGGDPIISSNSAAQTLNVAGNITLTGTVDGIDVADRDHDVATRNTLGIDTDDSVTFAGLAIAGVANFDTATGTAPFYISRLGSTTQSLKIRVDDNHIYLDVDQDENAAHSVIWDSINTFPDQWDYQWHIGGDVHFKIDHDVITSSKNHDFSAGIDVTGNITVSGTVDGIDIAGRDHDEFSPGVVTAHSDVSSAGSGAIITDEERTTVSRAEIIREMIVGSAFYDAGRGMVDSYIPAGQNNAGFVFTLAIPENWTDGAAFTLKIQYSMNHILARTCNVGISGARRDAAEIWALYDIYPNTSTSFQSGVNNILRSSILSIAVGADADLRAGGIMGVRIVSNNTTSYEIDVWSVWAEQP